MEKLPNIPNNKATNTVKGPSKKSGRRMRTRSNKVPQREAVQKADGVVNVDHDAKKVRNLECKVVHENFGVKTYETVLNNSLKVDSVGRSNTEINSRKKLPRAANNSDTNSQSKNIASTVQFDVNDKARDLFNEESRISINTPMPAFQDNIVSSTPVKGNKKYCAELLLNNSDILIKSKQNFNKKLPIYRQPVMENNNENDNLYEFDEVDYGIVKKPKKRRKRIPRPKEDKKPVYDILRNMIKHKALKVNKKVKSPKKLKIPKLNKNYNKIVEDIVQKIINTSKLRSEVTESVSDAGKMNKNSQNSSTELIKQKVPIVVSTEEFVNDQILQEKEIALDNISNEAFNEDISDTDDNFEPNNYEDKYFGFDSDSSGKSARINILSDITLNKDMLPNTNSTKLNSEKLSPWRFSENIKRNPYYISIKRTALPCIQQDMVLDYSQLEHIVEHFSKSTSQIETSRRSPVQKSILKYVTNSSNDNQENIPRPLLFDYEDFNPRSTKLSNNTSNKVKRKVLGPIQDNASNIESNNSQKQKQIYRSNSPADNSRNTDITYFGFEDTEEIVSVIHTEVIENMPFRIREEIHHKKFVEKEVLQENLPALPEPASPLTAPPSPLAALASSTPTSTVENQSASWGAEINLFEDLEEPVVSVTLPLKMYEGKRRKRKMLLNELENSEEDVNKKRHKKDIMTKTEEAELEKWAAKFNSVCAEIDKHELEIE